MAAKEILLGPGNLHAIVNKAMASASSFLLPDNRTRRPYLPTRPTSCNVFAAGWRPTVPTSCGVDRDII